MSDFDLSTIARRQRFLIWCILFELIANCVLPFGIVPLINRIPLFVCAGLALILGLHACVIFGVAGLTRALGRSMIWAVLCGLAVLAPLLGLIIVLWLNREATRRLREAGVVVGFLGADPESARRAMSGNICRSCGYDLTGNTSGRCPECGTALAAPQTCSRCGWAALEHVPGRFCPQCGAERIG